MSNEKTETVRRVRADLIDQIRAEKDAEAHLAHRIKETDRAIDSALASGLSASDMALMLGGISRARVYQRADRAGTNLRTKRPGQAKTGGRGSRVIRVTGD